MRYQVVLMAIAVVIIISSTPFIIPGNAIQLDGVIGDNEWKEARQYELTGSGRLLIKKENNDLYLAMVGGKKAWAHVYLSHGDTVRVIHASAALGEARYIKQNNWWRNVQTFRWLLREREYNDELVKKQRDHYLRYGWASNNNNMGNGMVFEFKLDLTRFDNTPVSFACVLAEVPLDLHYFPASLTDNTILTRLVQGNTPDSLQFSPVSWEKVR